VQAKKDDPFSGGQTYYCIKFQTVLMTKNSSIPATGMQAIPATGAAMGFDKKKIADDLADKPLMDFVPLEQYLSNRVPKLYK
jgi:2-oxoisovalerate dehydrogenase E1 component